MYAFHKEFAMFSSKCMLFLRFYKGLGPSAVGSQIAVVLSSPASVTMLLLRFFNDFAANACFY